MVKKQTYSNGINTPLSGLRDLYRASTSSCAISQNNQDIASRLSASYLDLTWQLLLQTNPSANLLAWERDNDSYTFTNQAIKYQKSTLASYQTSNNLYGGPFGGMENYFANIKTYFGQTKYDQMIEGFVRASSLYMDTIKLAEWHIYGSSRIGIYEANLCMASRSVRVESGTETQVNSTTIAPQSYTYFTTARGAKRFELTNHLGNVLAVITDKKVANCSTEVFSYWKAELVSATDYSPFGAPMPGRTYQASEYRFAFNGMEKVDEAKGAGNSYDFGARIHDPRLGRFLSVDPEYQKYPSQSSYCFAANSPIRFVDSEGKGVLDKIGAFFSRSYNLITKGDFKTTYEMQKDAYQSALQNRYDYYNMVLEADPTKANNNYLLSIPFLVDKFDAPNPDKDKLSEWKPDAFENTEMYLKSSSKNFGQSSDKVVAGILYGTINSPYILLTGESLGGETQTPTEKMDAFIDVAPGKLLGAIKATSVLKLKGGYDAFAKLTKRQFKGSGDEIFKQRSDAFKTNQGNASTIKTGENADKARGAVTETKKEAAKE